MGLLEDYFLAPIRAEQSYTYVNTIVYALLAFVALWLMNVLFKKTKTKVDMNFLLQLFPFIAIGSFLRILVDKNKLGRAMWNVSPGIYLVVAGLFLLSFLVAYALEKKTKVRSWKTVTILGSIIFLGVFVSTFPMVLKNLLAAGLITIIFVLLVVLSFYIFKKLNWDWAAKPLPFLAFSAQLFDATNTAFLVQFFGAIEKHPLPRLVINTFNSGFAFYPLKVIVALLALYFIKKEVKDKSFRNLLIVAIAVLGFAQGLRNILGFIIS